MYFIIMCVCVGVCVLYVYCLRLFIMCVRGTCVFFGFCVVSLYIMGRVSMYYTNGQCRCIFFLLVYLRKFPAYVNIMCMLDGTLCLHPSCLGCEIYRKSYRLSIILYYGIYERGLFRTFLSSIYLLRVYACTFYTKK